MRTHPLATNDIRQPTKQELANKCSDRRSNLYPKILIDARFSTFAVDIAQHNGGNVDGENVVPDMKC
jgi:hypothetical protein